VHIYDVGGALVKLAQNLRIFPNVQLAGKYVGILRLFMQVTTLLKGKREMANQANFGCCVFQLAPGCYIIKLIWLAKHNENKLISIFDQLWYEF
jgi:hypothetical protein